jgi:hypothetical protein
MHLYDAGGMSIYIQCFGGALCSFLFIRSNKRYWKLIGYLNIILIYLVFVGLFNDNPTLEVTKNYIYNLYCMWYLFIGFNLIRINNNNYYRFLYIYPELIVLAVLIIVDYFGIRNVYMAYLPNYTMLYLLIKFKSFSGKCLTILLAVLSGRRALFIGAIFIMAPKKIRYIIVLILVVFIMNSLTILDDYNDLSSNRINELKYNIEFYIQEDLLTIFTGYGLGKEFITYYTKNTWIEKRSNLHNSIISFFLRGGFIGIIMLIPLIINTWRKFHCFNKLQKFHINNLLLFGAVFIQFVDATFTNIFVMAGVGAIHCFYDKKNFNIQ